MNLPNIRNQQMMQTYHPDHLKRMAPNIRLQQHPQTFHEPIWFMYNRIDKQQLCAWVSGQHGPPA
jgi:hypothetical protein